MTAMLMNFLIGALVSFLGSLPVGILNVTIVHIALRYGVKSAFSFALASALVEMGYSYIAVLLTQAVFDASVLTQAFHLVSVGVFMAAGIHYLFKKPSSQKEQNLSGAFYQGTLLSVINVIAIPFWLVYTTLLTSHEWVVLDTGFGISYYILGITLGTFLSLMGFALLSHKVNKLIVLESRKLNRLMGILLIGTSLLEAIYLIK